MEALVIKLCGRHWLEARTEFKITSKYLIPLIIEVFVCKILATDNHKCAIGAMCPPHSCSHILGATLTNGRHCGRWLYLTGSPAVPSLARHLSSSVIWRPSPLLWCTFHWEAVLWRTQYRRSFVILSDLTGPTHGRISPPLSDSSVQHYPVVTYDRTIFLK